MKQDLSYSSMHLYLYCKRQLSLQIIAHAIHQYEISQNNLGKNNAYLILKHLQYILIDIVINLMISLRSDHSHSHHLPCHPTRTLAQDPSEINETDREQQSDNSLNSGDQFVIVQRPQINDNNTVQNRTQSINLSIHAKKRLVKPISNLTPQQIYHTDVFQSAFQVSARALPTNIRAMIIQKQKLIEDKVYLGMHDKGSELLQRIYDNMDTETHLKDRIQENLVQMMKEIHSNMEMDIMDGKKYVVHKIIRKTKDEILNKQKKKGQDSRDLTFNTSKSAGRQHRQHDNEKHDSQSFASDPHPTQQDFSLKSEQTKKVQEFIKKIQKQQQQNRKKRKEQEQRKKSLQVRSMEEKKQFQQQIKNQRKNYLKRRIQAKKQIKQKQLEVRQKMNQQYKQFLKKYKKSAPLFKEKQIKYDQIQQQQKKKQQALLQKRSLERNSINISQIIEYEKKYKLLKQQKQLQKSKQKKMNSSIKSPTVKYFQSKIYEVVAQQQELQKQKQQKQNPKLIRSQLIKKRDQYAQSVRQNYRPKGDEAKQKQLKDLMEKLKWTEKLKSGRLEIKDRNTVGNKNLQRLHQLIAQLRAKNKLPAISKTIDEDQFAVSSRPHYTNYLNQIKSSRKRYSSIDYTKVEDLDLEEADFRAKKLEQNAKRRQAYIQGGSLNIDRALQESKKADDEYLESVKAKMALLNKFN